MAPPSLLPVLAVLAGCAHAETTNSTTSSVIDIILPMLDSQTVMASIMGVDSTATSYYLTCPTDESSSECGLGSGMEVVEGSHVLELHMTETSVVTADISCSITSDTASCTSSVVSLDLTVDDSSTISSMATSTGTGTVANITSYTMPVTVTAGLDKLSATATGGGPKITRNVVFAGVAALFGGAILI